MLVFGIEILQWSQVKIKSNIQATATECWSECFSTGCVLCHFSNQNILQYIIN